MPPPRSWRPFAFVLVLFNFLFWAWSENHFQPHGWGPEVVREPQRADKQIAPELLTVKPASAPVKTDP